MFGAIAGDVIGSVYEGRQIKAIDFPLFHSQSRFTDDTVLTVATAHAIMEGVGYGEAYKLFGRRYPQAGYGSHFYQWIFEEEVRPYNSWGNGSAMRVSPVGWAFDDEEIVLAEARRSAAVSHDHPEGIKGAQAIAFSVWRARNGAGMEEIRAEIGDRFGYDMERTVAEIRPTYTFDVSCQGSVPEALIAFLESTSVEHAIRLAISLGGDSDTLGAMAGAVAHAFYGALPPSLAGQVTKCLPAEFISIIDRFDALYHI